MDASNSPYSFFPHNTAQILLIEDEESISETVALALSQEGFEVTVIRDGRMALEMIISQQGGASASTNAAPIARFDLVILDLMLPYVNGLDICRMLRREGYQTPVLMLSAKATEIDRVVGLEIGADDYLPKPFGIRELIARCRALLRRRQTPQMSPQQQPITIAEITLYPQECRVTVRGQEVNVSPKEFRLLEIFMRNPRRVWSREQLLEKVWGQDYVGDSKTVDVHIRWLREKLELDPSDPQYLITVRGFGYRLGR
ncbi:response regulator transcription factor [Alkalinema sp. FACHB-956]|uniref:response regulator transcription factor n=1 Tax=Alkalinema sp. FACHB-956 TaxID=2692768 RepID=UPI001689EDE8|nr:response regulator transcription factor [Alkalinema sp. FACHB-956]MBD2326475.1 response regulator transcription factor [Alkalinema sp. FACHB-956]